MRDTAVEVRLCVVCESRRASVIIPASRSATSSVSMAFNKTSASPPRSTRPTFADDLQAINGNTAPSEYPQGLSAGQERRT